MLKDNILFILSFNKSTCKLEVREGMVDIFFFDEMLNLLITLKRIYVQLY